MPSRCTQRLLLLAALLPIAAGAASHSDTHVLEDFEDAAAWQAVGTDDVDAALRSEPGRDGRALCLDFDFHGTAGSATLRRALPLDFPAGNYALTLDVRGDAPPNALQLKFVDAVGSNVWWHAQSDFAFPRTWQTLHIARDQIAFAWGPRSDHRLTHAAALELTVAAGSGGGRGSACFDRLTLTPLPPSAGNASAAPTLRNAPNAYLEARARHAPRGRWPRGFSGEQPYWTLVGVDGGADSGLLSEDGALELGKGGPSLEPFMLVGSHLTAWADVTSEQTLRDGYLPIPSVRWRGAPVELTVTAFALGSRAQPQLLARYRLHNPHDRAQAVTLALALRPLQVDPPTQFLNGAGGVSPLHALAWRDDTVFADGLARLRPLQAPDAFVATTLAAGPIVDRLAEGRLPHASAVRDVSGYASGALLYRMTLPPRGDDEIDIVVPLRSAPLPLVPNDAAAWAQQQEDEVAVAWRSRLDRVTLRLPPSAPPLADAVRAALAQILMSRDGAALRPGTRSYARSWIRDGAMMADALVRLGHADAARDYVRWYAPRQFSTGKVPCCVDARGADPTPENDSPGELLHAIAQAWRYGGDRALLAELWPHVEAAVRELDTLRALERTPANLAPARRALYGLLPASISHEGYAAQPQHSYWDDFWALTGYRNAVAIAQALGRQDAAAAFARSRDEFAVDLYASLRTAIARKHLDYLPGSAELGDFDPTSTTIALTPADAGPALQRALPGLLRHTFERYWHEFVSRRDGIRPWDAYTPYEWRNVGAFVRLGWRARIPALLDFFMAGRRPSGWQQWAEVVGRDPRAPRFVGDMPHAWVASDFIRATLDLFAYERADDGALVLAAGIAPVWLDGDGIAIDGLRTAAGRLSYTLRRAQDRLLLHVDGGLAPPPGGLVLTWPYAGATPGATAIDGRPAQWRDGELHIATLPADVEATVVPAPAPR